jgi:hypothetical protein
MVNSHVYFMSDVFTRSIVYSALIYEVWRFGWNSIVILTELISHYSDWGSTAYTYHSLVV